MPPPVTLTFDLEVGVGVACDLGYPCAKFRLPRPFGFRVRADVRDIRQTDGRTTEADHRLMPPPPPLRSGGIIISKTMFRVLSSWQSHCKSSPSSFDECRMAPSGCRPKTKPDDLGCESACTGCQNLHPHSLCVPYYLQLVYQMLASVDWYKNCYILSIKTNSLIENYVSRTAYLIPVSATK